MSTNENTPGSGCVMIPEGRDDYEVEVPRPAESLKVLVPENGSTGYLWSLAPDQPGLVMSNERTPDTRDLSQRIGASSTRTIVFDLSEMDPEDFEIVLVLNRPWCPNDPPARKLSIRVRS